MKVRCAKSLFSFAVSALLGMTAFADWSWSGMTGSVTIPSGTTATVSDSDVATVAALTAIEVESGATLSFENFNNRCVLAAALTGDGAVNAGDGAPVTFAGDNRSFTGAMRFTNSKIVVTSRYGLGSATDAGGAQRYIYSDGSWHSTARPNADGLRFRGAGLTNDVGICWYGNRADYERCWFADTMSDPLVFNGPLKMNKNGNVDWVKVGNWTFNGGLGEIDGTPCYSVAGGCKAYIRENPVVQRTSRTGYRLFYINSNAELHLCVGGGTWNNGNMVYGPGKLVCDAENVLPQPICALGSKASKSGTIDLNGYDQTIGRLTNPSRTDWFSDNFYWSPAPGEANYVCITSAVPATLTMTSDTSTTNFAGRFSGFASLSKTGSAPFFTFVNQYSDTKGTLSVSRGAVQFLWGAGWGGDISISGNGKVIFAEQCQQNKFSSGAVSVSGSAKLVVSNDVVFMCSSLTAGGTRMPDGEYTRANLSGSIEGDGTVIVRSQKEFTGETYTWTGGGSGWSDSASWGGIGVPGVNDKAIIPSGKTVRVLDADVAGIEATAAIEIATGGKIDFANASVAATISADISGEGDIRSSESAGITLNGDNFFHFGSMEFTNTSVYVTSRTGLGNPTRPIVHWGAGVSPGPYYPLRFRGNGLTNDVPVAFCGNADNDRRFTDNLGDPWVQNGYLDYIRSSDTPAIYLGDYVIAGGIRNTQGSLQFHLQPNRTCVIRNTPLALRTSGRWSHFEASATSTLRFEVAGNAWNDTFSLNGNGVFRCCVPNVLDATHVLGMARATEATILDLGGHDQQCAYVGNSRAPNFTSTVLYTPTRGSVGHGIITSATPATLTMISDSDYLVALKFSGMAGLSHTGTGSYTMVNKYSDTKGSLSVSAGAVKFDWGAGWGGDIAVSGNGKVIFAESCPSNKTSTATAEVTLADSAKLVVSNGARYCCAKLTMGSTTITSGIATAAKYPAWIEGAGLVHVGRVGFAISFR